jgi:hypothetical protein
MTWQRTACLAIACLCIGAVLASGRAQAAEPPPHGAAGGPHRDEGAPMRIGMEELHRQGGVPPGWRFTLPPGDANAGRQVFVKLECYQCHAIQGESFPQAAASAPGIGPELTGMGAHHPAEYFAESIVNPNAVIVAGPGYTDAAGQSIMPDYRDSLTVGEWLDLVAYLKSLGGEPTHGGAPGDAPHADGRSLIDRVVGEYRVRVHYRLPGGEAHGRDGHGAHGTAAAKTPQPGHLMAVVTDARTGEAVPYLPVTLTIAAASQAAQTITLIPMLDDRGFHYGAEVALPRRPATMTLSIGPTTLHRLPSAAGRFSTPQAISFDWTPPQPAESSGDRPPPHRHGPHGRGH